MEGIVTFWKIQKEGDCKSWEVISNVLRVFASTSAFPDSPLRKPKGKGKVDRTGEVLPWPVLADKEPQ